LLQSVCRSVYHAKTAEPIVMPLEMLTRLGPTNRVLDGDPDRHTWKGQFWTQRGTGPGHSRRCPAVDILKATQQVAAPLLCECRSGVLDRLHFGATWRIQLNRPCAAAMRPYVILLWPLIQSCCRTWFTTFIFHLLYYDAAQVY